MTWLEFLNEAGRMIAALEEGYICHAAVKLCHAGKLSKELRDEDQERILDQLDSATSYEGWLQAHHYETYMKMLQTPGVDNGHVSSWEGVIEGRLCWIDDMIRLERERLAGPRFMLAA